jgi:hypothetical protein
MVVVQLKEKYILNVYNNVMLMKSINLYHLKIDELNKFLSKLLGDSNLAYDVINGNHVYPKKFNFKLLQKM